MMIDNENNMAQNTTIKDFIQKQTGNSVNIAVPKPKSVRQKSEETFEEEGSVRTGRSGRPRQTDTKKVKMNLYAPEEIKEKLVRIQHQNYKSSLNDVLFEAVLDLIRKYDE